MKGAGEQTKVDWLDLQIDAREAMVSRSTVSKACKASRTSFENHCFSRITDAHPGQRLCDYRRAELQEVACPSSNSCSAVDAVITSCGTERVPIAHISRDVARTVFGKETKLRAR
jgi:hypothetical protein